MIGQVYKELGETPLEALERYRREEGKASNVPMTYAGRLDPMAEGWMYVLSGEDVYRKEEFTALDKSYELHVLWGVETDTYDLLGVPHVRGGEGPARDALETELSRWHTTFEQPYPPFSSQPVNGVPLWQWAREGKLHDIVLPTKEVTIYEIEHRGDYTIPAGDFVDTVRERCDLVRQDFRQGEIKEVWGKNLSGVASVFTVSKLSVSCSAGTYMRSLAHELGKRFGCGGCAFWIKRYCIGR